MSEIPVNKCPICGSVSFHEGSGFSKNPNEGNAYLKPALAYSKRDPGEFIKSNRIYQCNCCHSNWIDPWFTREQSKLLFDSLKSNHQAGWDQFEWSLKGKSPNYYMKWVAEMGAQLKLKNIKFGNYAELGCPFSGFSLAIGFGRFRDRAIDALFRSKETGSLWLKIDHILNRISKFAFYAIAATSKGDLSQSSIDTKRRTLITVDSIQGWGKSCVRMDRTCAGAALDSQLFDEVVNLKDVPVNDDFSFDFIGIFNYFDHLDNPLVCLDKLQSISKVVLVCTHAPSAAGWQHKFSFDLNFIEFLKSRYVQKRVSHLSKLFDNSGNLTDFSFIIES